MRKKITAACLATCIAASMLPSLIACGAPGAKEIENGTVKELSDGGAAIVSGDYRIKEIDFTQEKAISADVVDSVAEPMVDKGINNERYIDKEIIEKRTETSKQFLMDDGMIMVQNYGVPVHYEEEDGFKEIDNSLKLKTSETGEKYFENTANSFKVKLFEKLDKRKNVSIENKGYTLEFSLRDRIGEIQQLAKADVMGTEFNNAITKANKVANTDAVDYGYTGKDLTSVTQSRNGVTQLAYQFTDSKTQAKMTVSGDLNASYTYNYDEETGWLTNRTINLENSKTRTEWFTFDGHGVLQSQGNIDHKTLYGYDSLDRLSTKTQVVGSIERQKLQYNYISTTEYQTNRISSIYNITNSSRQTYSYNNRGYISSYNNTLNGDSYSYIYDGAGRLTSDGKYTYAYDTLNNITSKTSSGSTTEYGYWSGSKTRLQYISENGIKRYFSYDTMGNITNYKGSSTTSSQNLYWTRGNMLSHGNIQSGKNFSYQYGADNLRYSKTVNGEETLYYWDGDVLVGEKTGANYTQYLYDASGIIGMIYNGAYYYFEKNLFGDVLKAYNVSGTSVASFQYDSYGNVLSKSGSMWDKVHFRYRGYYYDEETSFYYLQSRYYDPSICRFISADQYELIGALSKSLGELNLYSYCANNPIIYTDGSGQSIIFWLILGSIVASGLITGFSAMNNSIEGESKLGAFIGGFVDGAVGAASLAAGIATGGIGGFFVTIGGSFIGGFTGNVINQLISYGNVDPKISAAQGFFSALTNGVIYVGFSFIGLVEGATWGMRFIDAVKLSPISLAFSAYFMYYAFPNVNKIRER